MTCSIAGCDRTRYALGLCNLHWQRQRAGVAADAPPRSTSGHQRADGYRLITPNDGRRRTYEHIIVAEVASRRRLPPGACVHHINENPADNRPENLVVCPSIAYHHLLHRRARALEACGNADWRVCVYCGGYAPELDLVVHGRASYRHRSCKHQAAP